jgi:20S proteasome alpha/beta subunit
MSIAIALIGTDGIILATDSRRLTILGGQIRTHNDNYRKLWAIGTNTAIAGVGNIVGYESQLVEGFQKQVEDTWDLTQIVERFTEYVRAEWSKATEYTDRQILLATQSIIEFIIIGYQDAIPKIKRVYWERTEQIIVPRNIEIQCGYYVAGIPMIAEYRLKQLEAVLPSMNIEKLKRLAFTLVHESTYFDSIGGPVQMAFIQKDVGVKMIPKDELICVERDATKISKSDTESLIKQMMDN